MEDEVLSVSLGELASVGDERLPALVAAEGALQGDDVEALRGAIEDLSDLSYKMTEKMYETLGADGGE